MNLYQQKILDSHRLVQAEYFDIASDFDIWVMKLIAITHRASYKDYVDLYYILQKYSLKKLIDNIPKKYWNIIDENIIKKTLVYMDDLVDDVDFVGGKLTKNQVKNFFIGLV